ncbi:type VI secretion system Vgr family protein, partial [Aquimarina agarivorans]|uniref:type VI secretion system Vgr family protein n=1 Tax=Aquimarina agarivorans TaxID=980584 RepID=UPI000248E8D0
FLGKPFYLQVSEGGRLNRETLYFKGKITEIKGKKGNEHGGMGDLIEVKGMSNSILLDDGSNIDSFLEKSVSDIIEEVTKDYNSSEFSIRVQPENDTLLSYSVQHHQSTFQYLQYLAATQGEYLVYSRDTLHFGKPDLGDEIPLNYSVDLKDFSLGLTVNPLHFNYYSNDYTSESTIETSSNSIASNASGYSAFANNVSKQFFPKKDNKQVFYGFESQQLQQQLDSSVALQRKLAEQKQVSIVGQSTNTGVSLGKVIVIKSGQGDFGRYRVIQITHSYKQGGTYTNNFTAIPLEIDVYPLTDIDLMHPSHPQVAKVIAVNDPNGMSRIKAQFPWQKMYNKTTPWIRVATPYAGGDRGFHLLPEENDEVLIGFENGDVERPYMQSALYTGVNKHNAWQSENNDFKGLTTKGGHVIELNDTKDGEMITITDKNGNKILIDTANNNMEISALENMTLKSKNLTLDVAENMNVIVGKDKNETISENQSLTAKKSTVLIEENAAFQAKELEKNAEKITINSTKDNMELSSAKQVVSNSGEKNILA